MMFPQVPDPTAPPYSPVPSPLASSVSLMPAAASGPDAVLAELVAGNARFVAGTPRFGHSVTAARAAADRLPVAAILGCMDARVPVEAVFDQDIGTVCAVRSAGHVLDRASLGSVELAVSALDIGLIVVLGHSRCAAVTAAMRAVRAGTVPAGHRSYVVEEIRPAVADGDFGRPDAQDVVTRRHTARVADQLRALFGPDGVRVAGGLYDVATGRVEFLS